MLPSRRLFLHGSMSFLVQDLTVDCKLQILSSFENWKCPADIYIYLLLNPAWKPLYRRSVLSWAGPIHALTVKLWRKKLSHLLDKPTLQNRALAKIKRSTGENPIEMPKLWRVSTSSTNFLACVQRQSNRKIQIHMNRVQQLTKLSSSLEKLARGTQLRSQVHQRKTWQSCSKRRNDMKFTFAFAHLEEIVWCFVLTSVDMFLCSSLLLVWTTSLSCYWSKRN